MKIFRCCACAAAVCFVAGCARNPLSDDYWPQPSPLGADIQSIRVPRQPDDGPTSFTVPNPTGAITLPQALALTLQHNPALASYAWEIRAREAQIIQARLWPNPEAEVEVENFGGSGPFEDFDSSETTISIGQPIAIGGRISKATTVAQHERDLAGWDYETARVAAFSMAADHFIGVLTAQRRVEIARDTAALAERVLSIIDQRVEAGKISPVESTKSRIEFAQAQLDLARAERALSMARYRLAADWGSDSPGFDSVTGDLEQIVPPPSYEQIVALVENNPDLARWSSEMALRRAAIELALAEAVPDLTIRGGVKLLDGGDETAFVAGASIPIPVFDRNQGNILEARIRQARGSRLRDAARVQVRTDLAVAVQSLRAAYDEVVSLRDEILPGSQQAFDAVEEAFRSGKIGALDLLDAERTLFDARSQYIQALGSYHGAIITVEQLIGAPLPMQHSSTEPPTPMEAQP